MNRTSNSAVMLLLLILDPTSGGNLLFTELPFGNNIIDTTYVTYPQFSATQCAGACLSLGYKLFSYDTATQECHLVPELTAKISLVPASPSRVTYFAWSVDGFTYRVTDTAGNWSQGVTNCEALGGKMALLPDTITGVVVHHLHNNVFLGAWRPSTSTDLMTWYDVDGNVITKLTKFTSGQPNNHGGNQFILRTYEGFVDDNSSTNTHKALCLVPN